MVVPRGKMPMKMPMLYDDDEEEEADVHTTTQADDDTEEGLHALRQRDTTGAVVVSGGKTLSRTPRTKNKGFVGIRNTRMRIIGKRASVRMCRKDVHQAIQGLVHAFVMGIMHDACAVETRKTLSAESVVFALTRRDRPVLGKPEYEKKKSST